MLTVLAVSFVSCLGARADENLAGRWSQVVPEQARGLVYRMTLEDGKLHLWQAGFNDLGMSLTGTAEVMPGNSLDPSAQGHWRTLRCSLKDDHALAGEPVRTFDFVLPLRLDGEYVATFDLTDARRAGAANNHGLQSAPQTMKMVRVESDDWYPDGFPAIYATKDYITIFDVCYDLAAYIFDESLIQLGRNSQYDLPADYMEEKAFYKVWLGYEDSDEDYRQCAVEYWKHSDEPGLSILVYHSFKGRPDVPDAVCYWLDTTSGEYMRVPSVTTRNFPPNHRMELKPISCSDEIEVLDYDEPDTQGTPSRHTLKWNGYLLNYE